ncbi:hypothetical protein GQX74_007662 [Glossina fuscipes]|nr:hypothetical protein GQX74_007662 [Glossina fuscipes]
MELNSELVSGAELLPRAEDREGVGILATAVMPFAFVRLWQVASKSNLRTAKAFEAFAEDSCGRLFNIFQANKAQQTHAFWGLRQIILITLILLLAHVPWFTDGFRVDNVYDAHFE